MSSRMEAKRGITSMKKTIVQTAILMAILTLISKGFGFIREMVMANYFGTSYITDAYVMSFSILSVMFGGIIVAISTAYIPVYSTITENQGEKAGDRFTSEIINLILIVTLIISIIGIIFSDQIISLLASGFDDKTAKLASFFIRTLFCYVIFSSIGGIFESYLQYKGIFLPQIVTGYSVSICIIVAIIISAYTSFYFLAFGMLVGYFIRFVALAIIAKRRDFHYEPSFKFGSNIKGIVALAIPTFIGSYMQAINQFVDKTLASRLVEGSISALNYASLLNALVVGLTIAILSTIIYPKLAKANSLEQFDKFNYMIEKGLTIVIMIALPCSLGAMIYSDQIVQIVYERGAFNVGATLMTGSAYFYYSIGLVFMSCNDLMTRTYYAMHNMKTPMLFAVAGVIINIVLNLILVRYMAHNGLALATSIAAFTCSIMLFIGLRKAYPHIIIFKSKRKIAKIIVAAAVSVGLSYLFYLFIIIPLNYIIVARLAQLMIAVGVAVGIYILMLVLFRVDEVKLIRQIIEK